MENTLRVLGKRGRITIPFAMRMCGGFKQNDVLSFNMTDADTIIVHREKLCNGCILANDSPESQKAIESLFEGLTVERKYETIAALMEKWGQIVSGNENQERRYE